VSFPIQSPYPIDKVNTIKNNGTKEGMTDQCFWISLLDYLHKQGFPELTLKRMRSQAGLNANTEHRMFDSDYLGGLNGDEPIFYNAATILAEIYKLRIQVYSANRVGEHTIKGDARGLIGDGHKLVEIVQFGDSHFELIDNYVPQNKTGDNIYIFFFNLNNLIIIV